MATLFPVFTIVVLIVWFAYRFIRKNHDYWKKRNVPFLEPLTIFGNFKDYILLKVYPPVITKAICEQFKDAPYIGVFYGTDPALVVKDPDTIKLILTKDFYYFNGREVSAYSDKEVITRNNVFFIQDDKWQVLRQNMRPLLTSIKIKNMFYLIKKCSVELEMLMDREYEISPTMEIRELMARFTVDVISSCAFGINSNAMGNGENVNAFRIISKKILEISTFNGIKNVGRTLWPGLFYGLGLKIFSSKVDEFFHKLITEVFEQRKYEPSLKNDFIDLILSQSKQKFIIGDSLSNRKTGAKQKVSLEVNDDLMVSQCATFFTAGFETSSTVLSFVLFELAKYEDVQKRAIAEVDTYFNRHENGMEHDIVTELPYLKACVDEALRMYPVLGVITREVMEEYKLPDCLLLEKGLRIHIPVYYLHLNPDNFENPETYDPERFLGDRSKDIQSYTYLPFGEGPRICIGKQFAKLNVLTGLVTILRKYTLKLADGMPSTVQFEPKVIVTQPVGGIRVTFTTRTV